MDYNLGQTLLVKPEVSFQQISHSLQALGWQEVRQADQPPLLKDEPEYASWTWCGQKPVLIYSFNPVARLRVLDAATLPPSMRGDIAASIPLLHDTDVDDLLFDPEPRQRLLGIWAARETERVDLIPQAHRLIHDPDQIVAEQSRKLEECFQRTLQSREELLINLNLLAEAAQEIIRELDNPMLTTSLKPTAQELKKLFDPSIAAQLMQHINEMYETPPIADPGDGYPKLKITAANAGLLRWPNELSEKFPTGYRNIAGWLQPQYIWLTWRYCEEKATDTPTQNIGGVHYDGLVWVESRWVWIPKAFRAVSSALRQLAPTPDSASASAPPPVVH